jgi:hypothetical protein
MHLRAYIIGIILLLGLMPGMAVALPTGQVDGIVLYGAGEYRAEVDGSEVQSSRSTYQQVALRYQNRGQLGDARFGSYTLMLGYEFNHLDPSSFTDGVRDSSEEITTGKVLYNASIVVAPGGLPFRLSAYARDQRQSLFASQVRRVDLPYGQQGHDLSIFNELETVNDLTNGTHHEMGITLLAGIRNGSYIGTYRDYLALLPRLLIDFRQIESEDKTRDFSQTHTRSRDLAFVSLNKKDNWLHFRMNDHTDFLNSMNNRKNSQVLFGTVDHTLARQWINLTNWIRISGDFSYTDEREAKIPDPTRTYNVNLFTVAHREKSQVSVLSNFQRETQGALLTQEGEVPVYFKFESNRDTLYRGRFVSDFSRDALFDNNPSGNSRTIYSSQRFNFDLGAELFRTRPVLFMPQLQLEAYKQNNELVLSEKVILEWRNNSSRQNWLWTAGTSLTASQKETDDASPDNYLEMRLYGSAEKELSRSVRTGGRASVTAGDGRASGGLSTSTIALNGSNNLLNANQFDSFLKSEASVFIDQLGKIYGNRLEFIVESLHTDAETRTTMEIRHELQRWGENSNFRLASSLLYGDSISAVTDSFDYVAASARETVDEADFVWSSEARYLYTPDRHLRFSLLGNAIGTEGAGNRDPSLRVVEGLNYIFYTTNGIIRKKAEISQELGWEQVGEGAGGRDSALYLRLIGGIYPTRSFFAKITGELIGYNPSGSRQTNLGVETGLNFDKLQVALSYVRKHKTQEGLLGEVQEDLWDVKVKKIF